MWGVSLTHPVLASCLCEEFLLHIPSSGEFLLRIQCWFHLYLGSFFYTSRVGFIFMWGVSLTHPKLLLYFFREFSYTSHSEFIFYLGSFSYTSHASFFFFFVLFKKKSGLFLLHIPCWLHVYVGSFSYTSRVLVSFFYASNAVSLLCGEFLLHIPCLRPFYLGSFSYTSHAGFIFIFISGFIFMWGVSLTHSVLASFLSGEFLLYSPSLMGLKK